MARLIASVPPLVKMTSPGLALRMAAIFSLASSNARRATRPSAWRLPGFAQLSRECRAIASITSGNGRVVEL
jgi:hypothetical protein